MVNLLALDTSSPTAALALATTAGAVHGASPDPSQRHGRNLIPAVRELLETAGLAPRDLGAIAVGLGPGSYTGLRIGVTAAKVLAYALGIPVVGLDSLEVLAGNAPAHVRHVAVIADAQRGDLYTAEFTRRTAGAPLTRLTPTRIERQDGWLGRIAAGTFVLGPGLDRLRPPLPDSFPHGDPAGSRPDPARLLDLAREAWASGRRDDPWELEPHYLRRSAAEEQWDQRSKP
ncbi:MAG: tRNA (adenosine(37)-N6)-threonylcarbamoyltransferase complex dimerization subunit type 1 TsaB [Isosphaeraceae bacterium]|nr:tRNA (adenosine(37)-N6)-threonylcarbamoyltransferase complex dimerization subunit type 1 TsaB [Isosphaeraceae bacterium]